MGKLRKIDTWFFDVKDVESKETDPDDDGTEKEINQKIVTKKVEIAVFMEKETTDLGGPPYMLKEVQFIVKCEDPKFRYRGTDIEALRYAAFENLNEHFKIKWEKYFLVTVDHARDFGGGISTGLTFSYNDVEKGTAWNGKELLRQFEWRGERTIKPWPGAFQDKNGRAVACIPETEFNKKALEKFAQRIDLLREMIRETIKPEEIIKTLNHLSELALLPACTE